MSKRSLLAALAFALSLTGWGTGASAQTRLLRFPDIQGDRVVFTYAGDLWLAPATGGSATRLTAHPGLEQFAKFSPDGQWIAFTGQYDGDEQVYVVPAAGGVPKQLTFYPARGPLSPRWGYDNQVLGWTPRRQGRPLPLHAGRLGPGRHPPLHRCRRTAASASRCPCRSRARATSRRTASGWPTTRSPATSAPGSATRAAGRRTSTSTTWPPTRRRNITSHPRTDRDPMWIGDSIYFNSDRTGTLNLYAYDVAGGTVDQVTQSDQLGRALAELRQRAGGSSTS